MTNIRYDRKIIELEAQILQFVVWLQLIRCGCRATKIHFDYR